MVWTITKILKLSFSAIILACLSLLVLTHNVFFVDLIYIIGALRIVVDKLSYYKPTVAFLLPWIIVYSFVKLDITIYSRPLSYVTYTLVVIPVVVATVFAPEYFAGIYSRPKISEQDKLVYVNKKWLTYMFVLFLALFLANVAYSGYLPLVNSLRGMDSDYMNYGIKGINGLFYAFANAFGLLSYYLYLKTSNKKYLYYILLIILVFLLCLTRQNLISLALETQIVRALVKKPYKTWKLITYVMIFLVLFGIMGELRSGDIRELMGLKQNYYWLPSTFIWIYSYGFFNLLNLDNLILSKEYALYNGSSVASLLPSFLRPQYDDAFDILEVINFTISSYINPVVKDTGVLGVIFLTLAAVISNAIFYVKSIKLGGYKNIAIYSVLFFCAFFSFFVNFWFYLPIIFQIPFIFLFDKKILRAK